MLKACCKIAVASHYYETCKKMVEFIAARHCQKNNQINPLKYVRTIVLLEVSACVQRISNQKEVQENKDFRQYSAKLFFTGKLPQSG
jgi:hypothetical protein